MTNHSDEKDFAQGNIQRCPHDSENPYSMTSNALIRDESISPNCRWLLIYLLSNKEGWKISVTQIVKHVKSHMGRTKVYKLINEAIESGYMKREYERKGNLIQSVIYYVSEKAKFKKSFRLPENENADEEPTENEHYKKTIDKNEHKKEDMKSESPARPSKADEPAIGLTEFFFHKLQEINPKIRKPDLVRWAQQIYHLLKTDKRSEEEVRKVIEYIVFQHRTSTKDFTWSKAVQSPEKLRKHFAAIWLEMSKSKAPQEKKIIPEKNIEIEERNRAIARKIDAAKIQGTFLGGTYLQFQVGEKSISYKFDRPDFIEKCRIHLAEKGKTLTI